MPVVLPVTVNDPLFRTADQIPLGRRLGLIESTDAVPSSPEVRPFGLCFATTMSPAVMVDLAGLRYDPHRQIGVDDTGAPVFGKHSTGRVIQEPRVDLPVRTLTCDDVRRDLGRE